jgi:peptidyl-prolyl cis-trans isomerase B (cyclophilin B)
VPADRFKGIPTFDAAKAAQPYTATLITTHGAITFRALTDKAPCTTYSFRFLAERFYYDLTHCHRLVTQRIFVLQCGDPTGNRQRRTGLLVQRRESGRSHLPHEHGGLANAGPNTSGSQFFFVTKDTTLHPNYTPFGVVTRGMDVLAKIAAAGEDDQNGPGDGYPNAYVGILHILIGR